MIFFIIEVFSDYFEFYIHLTLVLPHWGISFCMSGITSLSGFTNPVSALSFKDMEDKSLQVFLSLPHWIWISCFFFYFCFWLTPNSARGFLWVLLKD